MKFRLGHGIDVHSFKPGDHVMLGGIKIPHTHGIDAHSDGDVILHSITDALLGALGMGDLGNWFPDSNPELKDIASKDLIMPIIMSMRVKGFELNNLDVTVVAQAPRVNVYADEIRKNIASIFSANIEVINIKATTTEQMGYLGRKEGIACHTVISLIDAETLKESDAKALKESFEIKDKGISSIANKEDDDHTIDLTGEIDIRDFNFDD